MSSSLPLHAMGSASKLLRLLSAPFPNLCSSVLRLASISPAAASVARRPRILSAASCFLHYTSANLHTRAADKKAFADQEWICPRCNSTKCNSVLTCGKSECPQCNCKCPGAHGQYCTTEIRRRLGFDYERPNPGLKRTGSFTFMDLELKKARKESRVEGTDDMSEEEKGEKWFNDVYKALDQIDASDAV